MSAPPSALTWVEVLVDAPGGQGCYTYEVNLPEVIRPGDVVAVPFGRQTVGGMVLRCLTKPPDLTAMKATQLKAVEDVVLAGALPPDFWPLLERVEAYYLTPLAQVLRVVLPPGILGRSQRRIRQSIPAGGALESALLGQLSPKARALWQVLDQQRGDAAWRYLQQQVAGATPGLRELRQRGWVESYWQDRPRPQPKRQQAVTLINDTLDGLTARQQEILLCLRRLGGDLWLTELIAQAGTTRSVVQALVRQGRVVLTEREMLRSPESPLVSRDQPLTLTPAQAEAVEKIEQQLGTASQLLLQGVTGSGKTEVYLQAIATVLAAGKSALVLVPEIGLTPQLTDRFRARFGDRVLVYHSGLSVGERYDTWRQLLRPYPRVVVGTRSAIFAPLANLGLIVLDEEHDDSYKQDQPQPCYHARTVAQWRSQLTACPLLLGSATPALETYAVAEANPHQKLLLPERIGAKPMPPVEIIDLRAEFQTGHRSIFSRALGQALDSLAPGQQAILFMPRRGHSSFVSCRSCGHVVECPHCSVSLTFHQVGDRLRCHYCGYHALQPELCPECHSPALKHFGSGTQKVVDALQKLCPHLKVLRFDRDTTSRKGAHRALLDRFRQGKADVLVGTQMLTKGLDIPEVTLVGVMAADLLLNQADFRASERAFQLLTQVAGRAGRGQQPGRVLIQTYLPDHPTLHQVQAYDYQAFAQEELTQRQALGYPPVQRLICFRVSSPEEAEVVRFCEHLVPYLEPLGGDLLGPCPAQVTRVAGRYRWQILLKEALDHPWDPAQLAERLTPLPQKATGQIRLSIDVDPLRLL